mgnify:CR=1 FL=1
MRTQAFRILKRPAAHSGTKGAVLQYGTDIFRQLLHVAIAAKQAVLSMPDSEWHSRVVKAYYRQSVALSLGQHHAESLKKGWKNKYVAAA